MNSFTTELALHSVEERGVPNKERVVLYAHADVNTAEYALLLGFTEPPIHAYPLPDNLLWFGQGKLSQGDWLFVYTCAGEPSEVALPDGKRLVSIYWNRAQTMFYEARLVPILIRISEVAALAPPEPPKPLPHTSPQTGNALANLLQRPV